MGDVPFGTQLALNFDKTSSTLQMGLSARRLKTLSEA